MKMKVKIEKVMEHYEIFVDGKFYVSCDLNELPETLKEIEEEIGK